MDSLVHTLILGSYAWSFWIWRNLSKRIGKLTNNHLAHLEERVSALEAAQRHEPPAH